MFVWDCNNLIERTPKQIIKTDSKSSKYSKRKAKKKIQENLMLKDKIKKINK